MHAAHYALPTDIPVRCGAAGFLAVITNAAMVAFVGSQEVHSLTPSSNLQPVHIRC